MPSSRGDYQTNVAMLAGGDSAAAAAALAGVLRDAASGDISSGSSSSLVGSVEPAGGFLNLSISDAALGRRLTALAADPVRPGELTPLGAADATTLVDFSSPNMAKELHVGHLRSSVIGDTLARILEADGARVARVSHVGDAGVPVALVLTAYVEGGAAWATLPPAQLAALAARLDARTASVDGGTQPTTADLGGLPTAGDMSAAYATAKCRMEGARAVPGFAGRVQATLRRLQGVLAAPPDDAEVAAGGERAALWAQWRAICAASRAAYTPLLRDLDVHVREAGESTYLPAAAGVVADLMRAGVAVETDGAVGVFVDGADKPPFLLRKADGGFLYATVDVAALRARLAAGYTRIVYVTDVAQAGHFRALFRVATAAGWLDADGRNTLHPARAPVVLEHAHFGVVTGDKGKKLSSREGVEYTLAGLLRDGVAAVADAMTATAAAAAQQQQQAAESTTGEHRKAPPRVSGADIAATSTAIAHSAIRYFDLAHNRKSNYEFAFSRVLALKGNTAAYLLYATTRIASVRRNLAAQLAALPAPPPACVAIARLDDVPWPDLLAAIDAACGGAGDWRVEWPAGGADRKLAMQLARFPEALALANRHLLPSALTDYLHATAVAFHSFYDSTRILPAPPADATDAAALPAALRAPDFRSRLLLAKVADDTLRAGYAIVGLRAVSRM